MSRGGLDPPIDAVSFLIYPDCVTGKDVIRKLEAAGWRLDRIAGSHHIYVKDHKAVPIPVQGKRDLGSGLLAAIQRQTGVRLK
jgi:predicted RNA binding protein YcfA (HicA-like mRNA interferase family)